MKNKKITVAALIVAVLSLSIGFAAFSNSLNIKSSANVNPSDKDFKIVFSKERDTFVSGNEIISATGDINGNTKKGSINDTGDTLYNLETEFTTPGESVEYSLYIKNIGAYNAVLNKLEIEEAELTSDITVENYYIVDNGSVKCYAKKDPQNKANEQLLKEACNNIRLKVKLQQESEYITSTKEFDSYVINKGESESVTVTLEYTGDTVADTGFNVVFGSVKMNYATTKVSVTPTQLENVCYNAVETDKGLEIFGYDDSCGTDVVIGRSISYHPVTSVTFNKSLCLEEYEDCDTKETEINALTKVVDKINYKMDKESIALGYLNFEYDTTKTLSGSVNSIAGWSFKNHEITSVDISNSAIESIGMSAFEKNNITNILLNEGLLNIEGYAFGDSSISIIDIPSTVIKIGDGAFSGSELSTVNIKAKKENITIENVENSTFGWKYGTECYTYTGDIKGNPCITWVNG